MPAWLVLRRYVIALSRLRSRGVLDAAHDAFEDMLSVIRAFEDPEDGMFIPLVMAAASAADGRDAIAFAPSLPPRRFTQRQQGSSLTKTAPCRRSPADSPL